LKPLLIELAVEAEDELKLWIGILADRKTVLVEAVDLLTGKVIVHSLDGMLSMLASLWNLLESMALF